MSKLHATTLLLLLALAHVACRHPNPSLGSVAPGGPALVDASSQDAGAPDESSKDAAIALIREGAYAEARELLDDLLLERYLADARVQLERGSPEDALLALDRALDLDPPNSEGRFLKADASLLLAEAGIARGASGILIEGSLLDALSFFERFAPETPRAAVGACRAAHLLGRVDDAMRWARTATAGLERRPTPELTADPETYRTLANAFFAAYVEARGDEARAAETPALFAETEAALASLLGRSASDAWAWATLSDLHEWEGNHALARAKLEVALQRLPENGELLQRLARVAHGEGGGPLAIEVLTRYTRANPNGTLGHWYLGEAELADALERSRNEVAQDVDLLRAAEASFARCRELFPENEALCKGREVVCRGARGWCHFKLDELEAASEAFLSMNDVLEGGITWQWEAMGLRDGVLGLALVGYRHAELEDMYRAGIALEHAVHADPTNVDRASDAGLFLRDAAVSLESEARRLCKAANGGYKTGETLDEVRKLAEIDPILRGTDAERAAFRREADARFAEATDLMNRSWVAYQIAADLLPDNVMVVNDAGLVPAYYLHTDLDKSKALLERAIELGNEQVPALRERLANAPEAEWADLKSELLELEEAWGDAFQNLGVLYWLHEDDDERALSYLRRSVEIGPTERTTRPSLTNTLIPWIRGEYQPGEDEQFDLADWGRPCE